MKKLIALILIFGSFSNVYAQALSAKPVAELLKAIEASKFTYKEHALAFGYVSIQSCLYTSKDFAILKNYCYPNKPYPAKGFTIISAKYGVVELYQEQLETVLKRDIKINVFPEDFLDYAGTPTATLSIAKINSILGDQYGRYQGACWSSNFSRYTEAPVVECNQQAGNVSGLEAWGKETQGVNGNLKNWNRLMARLNAAIKK